MEISNNVRALCVIVFSAIVSSSCKYKNHIEKYEVNVDSLKTLPDGFYGYRGFGIYVTDLKAEKYIAWLSPNESGNVGEIFSVNGFENNTEALRNTVKENEIDTIILKALAQKFVDLSDKYKFVHITIDKANQITFSYKDGLPVQFARPLNDSVRADYLKDKDFKLLENGWFEYIGRR
jgi:hypothetical protein